MTSLSKDLVGREVSCRSFELLFGALPQKGLAPEALLEGSDCALEHLLNRHERVSWDSYLVVMGNASRIWLPDELVELGLSVPDTPWAKPFMLPLRLLYSARDLYSAMCDPSSRVLRDAFACVQNRLQGAGPNRLVLETTLQPGYAPCEAYFHITRGVLTSLPQMIGLEPATVAMKAIPDGVRYDIRIPPGGGSLAWLRRTLARPFRKRDVARDLEDLYTGELEAAYRELNERYQELKTQAAVRERAEEALRVSERRAQSQLRELENLYSNTPVGLCLVDTELRYVRINELLARMNGRPPAEHIGKTLEEMIPGFAPQVAPLYRRVLESGEPILDTELHADLGADAGGVRHWAVSYHPYTSSEGAILGVITIVQEITERRRTEAEREQLIAELLQKNAELERFSYTVSHDLKSPLVTIRGFLGLLSQDTAAGDADRVKQDIARVVSATDRMQQLLDDLLELSRVGRLMNPREPIPLTELAREAVALVVGQDQGQGLTLDIDPAMPVVHADRLRLLEVFQNLIENALKFMDGQPTPHVEVGAREEEDAVVCWVRDNGSGIQPAYQDKVFELFERLDSRPPGTGVGLALVKRVVELHGGRVWIDSAGGGQGSTFYFTIPRDSSGSGSAPGSGGPVRSGAGSSHR